MNTIYSNTYPDFSLLKAHYYAFRRKKIWDKCSFYFKKTFLFKKTIFTFLSFLHSVLDPNPGK